MNDPNFNSREPRNLQQEIQDALQSQDFTRLKDTIQDTVTVTVRQVKEGLSSLQTNATPSPQPKEEPVPPKSYQAQVQQAVRQRTKSQSSAQSRPYAQPVRPVVLQTRKLPGEGTALLKLIFGWVLTAATGLLPLCTLLFALIAGSSFLLCALFALLTVASVVLLVSGTRQNSRINRCRNYMRLMGEKGFYSLKQLALDTRKTKDYLVKDLQSMIQDNFFSYAKLDETQTGIILDPETYHQYEKAQEAYRQRKLEEEQFKLHPEYEKMKKIIAEGRDYIAQIRKANDDLPGEEISRKLDRLETSCTNLFDYVETHIVPASALRNAIDYYLPTTMKLVRGYQEFEQEPEQTEKIRKAKQDILDVLDTIPDAFDKLKETLYREKILDLSADIVTLKTVFAQDGLVDDKTQMKRN